MKKVKKLADGVIVNEDGKLVNKDGKRVNYKGEELIEIDAEAYMKAMELKMFSIILFVIAAIIGAFYLNLLGDYGMPPTEYENFLFLSLIGGLGGCGLLFRLMSGWKTKVDKGSKYVVNLPKSSVKLLNSSNSILGTVSEEVSKLDTDGDGTVLISEVYTLTEEEVLKNISKVDGAFSIDDFKDYVKSVFTIVQSAWSNNDYQKLRPYESDLLYVRHKLRIESMIKDKMSNRRTHVRVKGVLLKDFTVDENFETLVLTLTANMKVEHPELMFMNDNGDVPYILKFVRKKGVKTKRNSSLSTSNCPNCGAVIDVDDNGVCRYCETSLVSGDAEWVLADIRNIKISGI